MADREFAAYALVKGTKAAFLKFLAADGIVFNGHHLPVNGLKLWDRRTEDTVKLRWAPQYAGSDISGTFGFTTGPWVYGNHPAGDTSNLYGAYTTIWRKDAGNQWKVLVDIGVDAPPAKGVQIPSSAFTVKPGRLAPPVADTGTVLSEDRRFNALLQKDKYQAYRVSLSRAAILTCPEHLLVKGSGDLQEWARSLPAAMHLEPVAAILSPGKELAVVYGSLWIGERRTAYVRLWRYEGSGWKIVLETLTYDKI